MIGPIQFPPLSAVGLTIGLDRWGVAKTIGRAVAVGCGVNVGAPG